jgi:hypothetical protein
VAELHVTSKLDLKALCLDLAEAALNEVQILMIEGEIERLPLGWEWSPDDEGAVSHELYERLERWLR